jgi:hypothetical protein
MYEDDENEDDMVDINGEFVEGNGLTEDEEDVVNKFLSAGYSENRTLADIIMDKIKEKDYEKIYNENEEMSTSTLPPKVIEVYTAVGKLLQHYTSGKLPKALKMLPNLKNWEVSFNYKTLNKIYFIMTIYYNINISKCKTNILYEILIYILIIILIYK